MRRLWFTLASLAGAAAGSAACSSEVENEWFGPPAPPREAADAGPITDPANDRRCWVNFIEGGSRCGGNVCAAGSYCYSSVGTCKPGCRSVNDCPAGQACDLSRPPPGEAGPIGTCAAPPEPCAGLRSLGAGPGPADGCGDVRGVYEFRHEPDVSHPHCGAYRARCAMAQSGCTVTFECQTANTVFRSGTFELGPDHEGRVYNPAVPDDDVCSLGFNPFEGGGWGVDVLCNPPATSLICALTGGTLSASLPTGG
ncbi:MAG TPA: hypothetical protein VFS43_34805 [Polyangiaceae bacterium]|nr:hypothetical protein [Polyangiaceae bacterium]